MKSDEQKLTDDQINTAIEFVDRMVHEQAVLQSGSTFVKVELARLLAHRDAQIVELQAKLQSREDTDGQTIAELRDTIKQMSEEAWQLGSQVAELRELVKEAQLFADYVAENDYTESVDSGVKYWHPLSAVAHGWLAKAEEKLK